MTLWRRLFADAHRGKAALLFGALLVLPALQWTWIRLTVKVGYHACVVDPPSCDGETLVMSIFRVDRIEGEGSYVLEKGFQYVPVVGPTEGLVVGQDVSVGGAFRASDLRVVAQWREIHHLRTRKKVLGLLGLGGLVVAAPWLVRRFPDGWGVRV